MFDVVADRKNKDLSNVLGATRMYEVPHEMCILAIGCM
jgi:hypothetical protein